MLSFSACSHWGFWCRWSFLLRLSVFRGRAIVISLVVFPQVGEATGPCAVSLGEVERMGEPVPEDVVELKEDDWNGCGFCFG